MPRKPETPGTCTYCGEVITRRAVDKHLAVCQKRQAVLQASNQADETLWRLQIQPTYNKSFWLVLEMRGSASLNQLDKYLRSIWLECCGHLSEYTPSASSHFKIPKSRLANDTFAAGLTLHHMYDFGSTSHTDIKVLDKALGRPATKNPISLLARNQLPNETCSECEQKAGWLCMECLNEFGDLTFLCNEHYDEHLHEEGVVALVNSPRLGMCGYSGPAEPPY